MTIDIFVPQLSSRRRRPGAGLVRPALPRSRTTPRPRSKPGTQLSSDLNSQVQQLKHAQAQAGTASSDNSAALADLKRSTSDQYADLNNQIPLPRLDNRASVDNGRLQIASADGRFSAALRAPGSVRHRLLQPEQGRQ